MPSRALVYSTGYETSPQACPHRLSLRGSTPTIRRRRLDSPASYMRKKLTLLAFAVAIAALYAAFVAPSIARRRFEAGWSKVSVGMSRTEVVALLGKPLAVFQATPPQPATLDNWIIVAWLSHDLEEWAYGRRRLVAFEPTFPYVSLAFDRLFGPTPDDWVIYFSKDGRVVKRERPDAPAHSEASTAKTQ